MYACDASLPGSAVIEAGWTSGLKVAAALQAVMYKTHTHTHTHTDTHTPMGDRQSCVLFCSASLYSQSQYYFLSTDLSSVFHHVESFFPLILISTLHLSALSHPPLPTHLVLLLLMPFFVSLTVTGHMAVMFLC